MKRTAVVSIVLCLLLLFVFTSCDEETVALVENVVSPYEKLTLVDLKPFTPFVTENEDITEWPEDDLSLEAGILRDTFGLLGQTMELISLDSDDEDFESFTFTPRSIFAGFQLFIRDEGFEIEWADHDPVQTTSVDIDHLDLTLGGELNSLSNLLALYEEGKEGMLTALAADGSIRMSVKMRSETDRQMFDEPSNDFVSILSMFVDLSVKASAPLEDDPTGLLSGRMSFSMGSNVVNELKPSRGDDVLHHSPVIIQFDLAPFSDVDIAALLDAINTESDEDEPDYWPVLHEQMWDNAVGNLLTITRIIGTYNASSVRNTKIWTNEEAFALVYDFIDGLMVK